MTGIQTWKLNPALHPSADKLERVECASGSLSLNSASQALPGGVYTTFRTYGGWRVLPLVDHIHRLEESARLVGQPLRLDRGALQQALRQVVQAYLPNDTRLRVIVDLEQVVGTIYLLVERLLVPSQAEYDAGVEAVTYRLQRANPQAKQTAFIALAEEVRQELPPGVNESLLVGDDGQILEGLSSNFFAIKAGGLWTAGQGMLPGLARALALEAAGQVRCTVRLESIKLAELAALDEAFITSSSRSVLPVRRIDQTTVGTGHPGPFTQAIQRAYWQLLQARLEDLLET